MEYNWSFQIIGIKFFEVAIRFPDEWLYNGRKSCDFLSRKFEEKLEEKRKEHDSGENVLRIDFERFHTLLHAEPG